MATTGICNSFKVEMLQAGHCFNATLTGLAGAGASGTFTITGLANTLGISVGMLASGTNVAAGAIVASIDSPTQVTVSKAHTGVVTSGSIGFAGDIFKSLLVKVSPTLVYAASQTNVGTPGSGAPSTSNVGTDEVVGAGYTSGGFTNGNITPSLSTTTAVTQFTPNPSWTAASFSATAMISYNSSQRFGGAAPLAGHTIIVNDFGGTQTVASGTFTVLLPVNAAGTALIQVA